MGTPTFQTYEQAMNRWRRILEIAGEPPEIVARPPMPSGVSETHVRRVLAHVFERIEALESQVEGLAGLLKRERAGKNKRSTVEDADA